MKLMRDRDISKKVPVVRTLSGLFIYAGNGVAVLKYRRSVPRWV